MTHSVNVFIQANQARQYGQHMTPRSRNDKEYFPQDWFIDRLDALGVPYEPQGRNSYPDFWVGGIKNQPKEGYEIKSLRFSDNKPARRDYDSNSTVPSGRKDDCDIFLEAVLKPEKLSKDLKKRTHQATFRFDQKP